MSGTVIQRGVEPGEMVVPGVVSTFDSKALLTIADLSTLIAKANLNQIDVARVALKQKATLTLDALPGKTYDGVIFKVAPASVKLTGKDQEVFPVEVLVEKVDGAIKPGMTADVRVLLDEKADTLAVPIEALSKEGGKSFATKVTGEKSEEQRTERVEVAVGARTDREVEVLSGLAPGDRILLRPPSSAENETKL
jgi:HlyD family secretion protein/macrolide-specific efflux system membrane fusion protein